MKVFGLVGWHNSGKTTLIVQLIDRFVGLGLSVSTMKHGHHEFDIDQPGKDSHRHRAAGATEVLISSSQRWALMHENRAEPEASMDWLLERITPVDLLLVEGFKRDRHPKLEVHRPGLGQPLLCPNDPTIVAVASDAALEGLAVPLLDLNDIESVVWFIMAHLGLQARPTNASA
ncbi:MAG: molybdopterin-guanine dinucleotide biosynthesis protein B [Rhodospirillales bacterium]|nr:molybdopterin-guanine dinucleotide biosynthesis protein B [Rhodospirillales bacterium]